jgi:hypothetical protein
MRIYEIEDRSPRGLKPKFKNLGTGKSSDSDDDDHNYPTYSAYLKSLGYTFLGQGGRKMVFQKPGDKHVLIVADNSEINNFKNWTDYCLKNSNNIFLPKFYTADPAIIEHDSQRYFQIKSEKLYNMYNSDIPDTVESFLYTMESKGIDAAYEMYVEEFPANIDYYLFVKTIVDLYKKNPSGGNLDLGSDNVLGRADGTWVLNDPW